MCGLHQVHRSSKYGHSDKGIRQQMFYAVYAPSVAHVLLIQLDTWWDTQNRHMTKKKEVSLDNASSLEGLISGSLVNQLLPER